MCFLSPCILVINPVKNHGYWDALVLPVSVCFKTLPLPSPLLEAALLLACRASDWHCGSFQYCLTFYKPSHHGMLFPAAMLKRRWQNIAQLGVKPVLWAAITPVGVWSLKMSAHEQILFVFLHCLFCLVCFFNVPSGIGALNVCSKLCSGCLWHWQAPEFYFSSLWVHRGAQVLFYFCTQGSEVCAATKLAEERRSFASAVVLLGERAYRISL